MVQGAAVNLARVIPRAMQIQCKFSVNAATKAKQASAGPNHAAHNIVGCYGYDGWLQRTLKS